MSRWLNPEEDAAPDRPLSSSIVQRLQRFGTYGRLKQAALRKVAHNLAADDAALMDLQKAFAKMDPEGTGSIRYSSLSQVRGRQTMDLGWNCTWRVLVVTMCT